MRWFVEAIESHHTASWFDVLNTIMVIRSTVKPREKSPEDASEDSPGSTPGAPTRPIVVDGATVKP